MCNYKFYSFFPLYSCRKNPKIHCVVLKCSCLLPFNDHSGYCIHIFFGMLDSGGCIMYNHFFSPLYCVLISTNTRGSNSATFHNIFHTFSPFPVLPSSLISFNHISSHIHVHLEGITSKAFLYLLSISFYSSNSYQSYLKANFTSLLICHHGTH